MKRSYEVEPVRNTTDKRRFPSPSPTLYSLSSRVAGESQVNGMSGYFGTVYLLFFFICTYIVPLLSSLSASIYLFLTFIRFLGVCASGSFATGRPLAAYNSRLAAVSVPLFPFRFLRPVTHPRLFSTARFRFLSRAKSSCSELRSRI